MYTRFFGLRERPFELTPDPRYLYLSTRHREAISNLKYGLLSAKSVTLLLGEAGTGKTTVLNAVLESPDCRQLRTVSIKNPALTREEFVEMLANRFELPRESGRSKAALLATLDRVLPARRAAGVITALVIDEAQALGAELLEEVRLLANFETPTEKLLPVVLAGQSELGERLEEPSLRQLKQRVALRCEIVPFSLSDTAAYIASRIAAAGGVPGKLFTREAVTVIHEYSGGIPRTINVICDNALVTAMALSRQPIDQRTVLEVCSDFWLHRTPPGALEFPSAEVPRAVASLAAPPPLRSETVLNAARPELFSMVSKRRPFGFWG